MLFDNNQFHKEISRLGSEALMFWELPKVDNALHSMCKRCFFCDCNCKADNKTTLDLTADSKAASTSTPTTEPSNVTVAPPKGNEQLVELGFVEKLIKLWKLRRRIAEAKSKILVSGTLAKYTYKAGEAIMNKSMNYRSNYMSKLFKARNNEVTLIEK